MEAAPTLDKLGWTQVNLPDRSHRWVVTKTYAWSRSASDTALIAALISHPTFRDHYCAPGDSSEVADPVHGPYRLEAISVEAFQPASPETAVATFDAWLSESLGEAANKSSDPAVADAVRPARSLLTTGDAGFYLPDLGEAARHEWGWVLWHFREWIVIDRGQQHIHTVAAGLD